MRRALCALIVLVSTGTLLFPSDAVSRQIASLYAREASALFADDGTRFEDIEQLVERALELDADQPDALHLRAVLGQERGQPRAQAIAALSRAIEISGFRHTSRREAMLLLGQLLLETDRPADAVAVLEPLYAANNPDPEVLIRLAQAFFDLEDTARAETFAELGRQIFADDPRFVSLLALRNDVPGVLLLDELSVYAGSADPLYQQALLHYIRNAAAQEDRVRALGLYEASAGNDPLFHVYDIRRSEAMRRDAFIAAGGARDPYAVRAFLQRSSLDETAEALRAELQRVTGRLSVDPERRGRARIEADFQDGRLTGLFMDSNTDGIPELELRIDPVSGLPSDAILPQQEIHIRYRRYPEVASVLIGSDRYGVRPGMLRARFFESTSFWEQVPVGPADEFPRSLEIDIPQGSVLRRSAYVRESTVNGRITTVDRLFQGQPVLRMQDSNGDGMTDTVVYFEHGVVVRAIRDVLGDGVFEVLEEYRDGLLFMVGLDTTQDGIYDYIERYEDGILREWDTTADGRVDIREQAFADSTRRAEFLQFLETPAPAIDRVWNVIPPVF